MAKRFTRGIGDLTAIDLNRIFAAVEAFEEQTEPTNVLDFRSPLEQGVDRLLVLITGYSLLAGNRYKYSWVEVAPDPDNEGKVIQVTNGQNSYTTFEPEDLSTGSPFTAPAYNLAEVGNDGLKLESGGVNVEGVNYPTTWYLQPYRGDILGTWEGDPGNSGFARGLAWCPGGVLTFWRPAAGGDVVRYFSAVNVHDGTCV